MFPAFQSLKKSMEEKKEVFVRKCIFEQVRFLTNIVGFLRRGGSNGVDLSVINESSRSCPLRVGYDITNINFAIIHQSPCGLVERIQKV